MAEGTKLVLEFYDSNGSTVSYTYNYAKPSAGLANVQALMNGMITNTAVLAKTLVTKKSAKEVTTTETEYTLTDNVQSRAIIEGNPDHTGEGTVTEITR